jgi:hypothetical protein
MENQGQASTEMPRALTRGYSNSYLDTLAKRYVPAVDQPPLTVADLDAMDQHHGR